jgi:hypothetical protein
MRSSRSHALLLAGTLALPVALFTACGPGRTAAATQTTPAAFDASKSDAKAVEIADQVIAASGGEAAWTKAKQIEFTAKVTVDGQEKVNVHHVWDRWNGRHHFEKADPVSKAELMVGYEQFGDAKFGEVDGHSDIPRDQVAKMKGEAEKRIAIDAFNLLLPFKLKDPGVTLKFVEERPDPATPDKMAYDVVKMTFDAGVGLSPGDVYYVVVDKASHLIHHIEMVESGKADDQRIGYKFDDYQDIGGLKLSLKRQNIGYAAEQLEFTDVKVSGEVDEEQFVPKVQ